MIFRTNLKTRKLKFEGRRDGGNKLSKPIEFLDFCSSSQGSEGCKRARKEIKMECRLLFHGVSENESILRDLVFV
jgi:hypothetical protein